MPGDDGMCTRDPSATPRVLLHTLDLSRPSVRVFEPAKELTRGLPDGYVLRHLDPGGFDDSIAALRVRVWCDVSAAPEESLDVVDDRDPRAHHWLVYREQTLVASARLTVARTRDEMFYRDHVGDHLFGTPCGEFMRLVVAKEHRGRSIGRVLDAARLVAARDLGCLSVVGVSYTRPESLERRGFRKLAAMEPAAFAELHGYAIPTRTPWLLLYEIDYATGMSGQ